MYFACNAIFYNYYIFLYRCQGFYLRLTNKYVCEAIIRFHNIRIWNYFFSDTTRWNAEFLVIQRYLIVLWLFSLTYLFCVYFVIYKDMLIPRVYTIEIYTNVLYLYMYIAQNNLYISGITSCSLTFYSFLYLFATLIIILQLMIYRLWYFYNVINILMLSLNCIFSLFFFPANVSHINKWYNLKLHVQFCKEAFFGVVQLCSLL